MWDITQIQIIVIINTIDIDTYKNERICIQQSSV
jgi:hypothetical protein